MAKNTGENYRKGSVKNRSQTFNPQNNRWVKRNTENEQFLDQKANDKPFKGVAQEKDGCRH
ncbi:hypothetical protein PN466_20765 [Roseofilum reptotaenium CS-1145]|uniref:Uncharacterized protein n=1 Tax=Roseofilum reptotaenium AO1-A TaxID=1925591 RepID=A0A1L9QL17_9CYAN|nr:hypothetical protein [Roseofilum reptotaenium]MDB9519379.1 hypothetical protein [Roseofilum reptotaenium CS-1145]OJJ18397.1 hypothetical protein BI308_22475 [Roseofilum reptotaenium AO1-A]